MKNSFIKIGGYLLLISGIIISIFLFVFSVYIFIGFPDSSVQKRATVGGVCLVASIMTLLISIALFEAMLEVNKIEQRSVKKLENK